MRERKADRKPVDEVEVLGNPLLTWFLNRFFKAGVSDAHSGFRALTRV